MVLWRVTFLSPRHNKVEYQILSCGINMNEKTLKKILTVLLPVQGQSAIADQRADDSCQ